MEVYVIGNYQDVKRVGTFGDTLNRWHNIAHRSHERFAQDHWSDYRTMLRDWLTDLLATTPKSALTSGEIEGLEEAWKYYC